MTAETKVETQETKVETKVDPAETKPDLDSLLKEFEISTTPKTEAKAEKSDKPDEVSAVRNVLAQLQYEKDIGPAIELVRGDMDKETFDPKFVETWMESRAKEDPRIMNAWLNRKVNPTAYTAVMKGLGEKFKSQYGKLVKPQTDSELLAAAVKSASQTNQSTEQAPDYHSMSNHAFQSHKAEMLRAARKGAK